MLVDSQVLGWPLSWMWDLHAGGAVVDSNDLLLYLCAQLLIYVFQSCACFTTGELSGRSWATPKRMLYLQILPKDWTLAFNLQAADHDIPIAHFGFLHKLTTACKSVCTSC